MSAGLAARYVNPELGQITVRHDREVQLDFGSWASRVASRNNDDDSIFLITLDPTYDALELIVTKYASERALIVRDGQREYVYEEASPP